MGVTHTSKSREWFEQYRKDVAIGLAEIGQVVESEIKAQLSLRGSTKAEGNIPSPPGTPPALQTGNLRRSWNADYSRVNDPVTPSVTIGSNSEYARIHEFGGQMPGNRPYIVIDGHAVWMRDETAFARQAAGQYVFWSDPYFMPPRPYVGPALDNVQPVVIEKLRSIGGRRRA